MQPPLEIMLPATQQSVKSRKETLMSWIDKWNCILHEYELNKVAAAAEPEPAEVDSPMQAELSHLQGFEWYMHRHRILNQSMISLHHLRLLGDEFSVVSFSDSHKLLSPTSVDRLQIGSRGSISFGPMTSAGIHQVASVWREDDNCCCVRWLALADASSTSGSEITATNKKSHARVLRFTLTNESEAEECVQVLGTHLRHYNQKKSLTVRRLQVLAHWQSVAAPINAVQLVPQFQRYMQSPGGAVDVEMETVRLSYGFLVRLWNAAVPDEPRQFNVHSALALQSTFTDKRWTWLGFQNSSPMTDFRGTGLLGLWFLVYMAEKSLGRQDYHQAEDLAGQFGTELLAGSVDSHSAASARDNLNSLPSATVYGETEMRRGWVQELVRECREQQSKSTASSQSSATSSAEVYPWAVAGINVCALLMNRFLNASKTRLDCLPSDPAVNTPLLSFLAYLEPDAELEHVDSAYASPAKTPDCFDGSGSLMQEPASPLRRVSIIAAPSTLANARNASTALTSHGNSPSAILHVEEFFCFSMDSLDRVWRHRKATYMDFPAVMEEVQQFLGNCIGITADPMNSAGFRSVMLSTAGDNAAPTSPLKSPTLERLKSAWPFKSKSSAAVDPLLPYATSLDELWARLDKSFVL